MPDQPVSRPLDWLGSALANERFGETGNRRTHTRASGGRLVAALTVAVLLSGCREAPTRPVPVASLVVTPLTQSLNVGATAQLTATPRDAAGNVLTARAISWSSSNSVILSVNTAGRMVGVAAGGPVVVTATSEGVVGTTSVTVTPAPVPIVSVDVTPPAQSLSVGATAQLTATPKDAAGNVLIGRAITWSSSQPTIASVSSSGLVTGVSNGEPVEITATSEGATGFASITVAPGIFVTTGGLSTARRTHTATLLQDGTVLIAGGSSDRPQSAELYDPALGIFIPTGDMAVGRARHTATLLHDGRVLLAGGGTLIAELYDPATKIFSLTGAMVHEQVSFTATLLSDGRVLIAGGVADGCCPGTAVRAELYDPSTGRFTETGVYAQPGTPWAVMGGPALPTATLLHSGQVLLAGEPLGELYDPTSGTFGVIGAMTTLSGGLQPPYIAGRAATLLGSGVVLLTGGENEDLGRFANAELYTPALGQFTQTGPMSRDRQGHTATLLANGQVLVIGGESVDTTGCGSNFGYLNCIIQSSASAEVYDPSTSLFSAAGTMSVGREWHTATLLRDGRVLVVGGEQFVGGFSRPQVVDTPLATAELYILGGASHTSAAHPPQRSPR